jgi:basic membrane lipoprotein Med (substrate-binding protein (PBP1-ABC) superfamily)/DNA-binding SARP family transcriptional activator
VPLERLIDEVWGEDPPASAPHAVEAYVSRLRPVLEPHGPELLRRGPGYRLDLGDADLDVRRFEALLTEADLSAEQGDAARTAKSADQALGCWRGPALVDTPLLSAAHAEIERLEELRLRALERRSEAGLALGRHQELAGELRKLVEEHPLREAFVAQLMIALYRSGRQADALEVYERTRQAYLELGLHPSRVLQELSGAIVRQEDELQAPSRRDVFLRPRPRRRLAAAALAALAVAAAAIAFGATRGTDEPNLAAAGPGPRVALLLPRPLTPGENDPQFTPFVDGFRLAARQFGLQPWTLVSPEYSTDPAVNERVARRVRQGRFDLVLLAAATIGGEPLLSEIRHLERTRFVYLDAFISGTRLAGIPNVSAVAFADEQAGYLAGYLSGLVEARRSPRIGTRVISAVGNFATVPSSKALVDGFARGAHRALPSITVLTDYSNEFVRQAACQRIANRQIDDGSEIVFAPAGTCGLGALAAASVRGVLGVGADQDHSYLGGHILASTFKRLDRAVLDSIRWYIEGTLPRGREIVLALDDDAVGVEGIAPDVPTSIRRQVARVEAELRARSDGRVP